MPYGTPQGPADPLYKMTFRSTTQIEGYPVTFQVLASTENLGDARVADLVQQFADVVHASPEFLMVSGSRLTSYTETLTPTAVQ